MRPVARTVALFADQPVRCWPWEQVTYTVPDEIFRTEAASDWITIRGTLTRAHSEELHAEVQLTARALVAFERTGQRGFLVDAVRHAMSELAEKLATRPDYTPPPHGWRKFGRVGR